MAGVVRGAALSWGLRAVLGWGLLAVAGCASAEDQPKSAHDRAAERSCPKTAAAPEPLPGTSAAERTLEYWLDRANPQALDKTILTAAEIAEYNARHGRNPEDEIASQRDMRALPDPEVLQRDVRERLGYLRAHLASHALMPPPRQAAPDLGAFRAEVEPPRSLVLRVALQPVQLRCGPYDGPLHKSADDDLDRNACGMIRTQEVVQMLDQASNGMWLVRTRYAMGYLASDAALSTPLPAGAHARFVPGARLAARAETQLTTRTGAAIRLPAHSTVPVASTGRVLVATRRGVESAPAPTALVPTQRPLTRRALLEEAFSFLGTPYGLGGQGGGRDCSRLIMDLFERFDLALPRHSGWQAEAGSYREELPAELSAAERVARFEAANARGIVLLSFPGHIMLYLGQGEDGPRVLHSLGEYVRPCGGGEETVVKVRRVVVSDLTLGRGSSRRSLLERITRMTVFGPPPDRQPEPALPLALPATTQCRDSRARRVFVSPEQPSPGAELRAIAVTAADTAAARLTLWSSDGEPLESTSEASLGGPPFGHVLRHTPRRPGTLTVTLTRGSEVLACRRFAVEPARSSPPPPPQDGRPLWLPERSWDIDTEHLWSAFVESLFDFPSDDETTWDDLHTLLQDRTRNLLWNHLGLDEDQRLILQPDCADLPYMLRGYFAWKLRLPFAFRRCSRGRPGHPPRCGPLVSNLSPRPHPSDLRAFQRFARRAVRNGVHSASGRTVSTDSETDLYPVAVTRESLPPGTVYADPYGHVMILSKWYPQGAPGEDRYGILMATEAQPDGTIGRRRFWEGSFLFEPDETDVGAGFKHFRPLRYAAKNRSIEAPGNRALVHNPKGADFSRMQYGLTQEAFYDRMDALINPHPLSAGPRQEALIDALEESVRRRIESVDNAIHYFADGGTWPIGMPHGTRLFQTTGPWEDYSTPSRDMRLLIAIDTVLDFPNRVQAQPERYAPAGQEPDVRRLRQAMEESLARRSFSYERSDGSSQQLTLQDVIHRRKAFEMAYNPNDCIEIRWGAPEGSKERSTCDVRTVDEQQARMQRYRPWFADRRRPQPGMP